MCSSYMCPHSASVHGHTHARTHTHTHTHIHTHTHTHTQYIRVYLAHAKRPENCHLLLVHADFTATPAEAIV
jgi:hypothetical protein